MKNPSAVEMDLHGHAGRTLSHCWIKHLFIKSMYTLHMPLLKSYDCNLAALVSGSLLLHLSVGLLNLATKNAPCDS